MEMLVSLPLNNLTHFLPGVLLHVSYFASLYCITFLSCLTDNYLKNYEVRLFATYVFIQAQCISGKIASTVIVLRRVRLMHPKPIVKWAGGKTQLLPTIKARLPKEFGSYYEPFLGGGALLFDLMPTNAVVNDVNTALVNMYLQIKDRPQAVVDALNRLDEDFSRADDNKAFYYSSRETYNQLIASSEYNELSAAYLVFLNKHCFNGIYRVNSNGLFNVPFNGSSAKSFELDNIFSVSSYLQTITILNGDFEIACASAQKNDFVFFDSPYAPLNPTSFEAYTKEGFAKEEHERLANLFKLLDSKGCYLMLTNHATDFIKELYADYRQEVIEVRRSINSDASNRKGVEIIVRNY